MSRILVVTRNYPPLWGGMERLNLSLVEQLARRHDVMLIAPTGAEEHAPRGVTVRTVPGAPISRFLVAAVCSAVTAARRFRPDYVLGGSGLVAPAVLIAARSCGAQSGVYVHGLDLAVRHIAYRTAWIPALRRIDQIIANSSATRQLALDRGIRPERIHVIHPGVTMPEPDPAARARFRNRYGLSDRPVLLSVGRLTTRKGLREFVADVLPRLVQRYPSLVLVIIGDAPTDALHAQVQTPESIQAVADRAGVGANIRFLGKRFGQELEDAYAGADVHVFPVRALPGDPEGFGMVAVEAAAHGLPTVAYATGGVVDAVREGVSGRLIPPGDEQAFADAVLELLMNPIEQDHAIRFAESFEWREFGGRLASVLPRTAS